MKAGRELDALVAEHVMGLTVILGTLYKVGENQGRPYCMQIPCYSTDISAAWQVVEALNKRTITVEVTALASRSDKSIKFIVYTETALPRDQAIEYTVPHAICLAALRAVGVLIPTPAEHPPA